MNLKQQKRQFFTIRLEMILTDVNLPYDIFINSSSIESRDHFVRIIAKNQIIKKMDVVKLKRKYNHIFLLETDRSSYLNSLMEKEGVPVEKRTNIVKDTAIEYLDKIFNKETQFSTDELQSLVGGCQDSVEGMVHLIKDFNIFQIQDLIGKMSFHDFYTFDHSINVSMYVISFLKALKPNSSETEMIEAGMGGLLHDLGKIKISTSIINNPGKLSDEDFSWIRQHPIFGIELLDDFKISFKKGVSFDVIKRVINEHHENVNGTGYPNKKDGKDIHLFAKMTSICDFFDAITTKRSYHEVLSTQNALNIMEKTCDKKIDRKLFKIFSNNILSAIKVKPSKEDQSTHLMIDEYFDPCMPHNNLPFKEDKSSNSKNFQGGRETQFGKVYSDFSSDRNKRNKK